MRRSLHIVKLAGGLAELKALPSYIDKTQVLRR